MSYNRKNTLERIIRIQNITLDHQKKGVTQKWVYHNVIYPTYMISYSCYNKYLARNARRELRELLALEEQEQREQITV